MLKRAITQISILAIVIGSIFLANGLILAWSSPGSAPPDGNASAPINISGTSQTKSGTLISGTDIRAPIFYDQNNTGYYTDPASNSWLYRLYSYDLRSDIYYDRNNTGYYVDPASTSNLNIVGIGTASPATKLQVQGGHGDSMIRIFSDSYNQGVGGANTADLNLWASEPGWTWTGVGIGNNMISGYYGRRATNRGASYIRLLDNQLVFNTVDSAGADRNAMTISNGAVYVTGTAYANGQALCQANGTNCPSTSGLYLPLAGGTMNAGSRVGFNGGTTYGVGQGAASPNLNSIAVDTLETDGGVGGSGTLELNYYGGNEVHIGPSGTKVLRAAIMYDGNNGGYYIDPASTSRINYGVFDNVYSYGWMQSPIFYDANNTGYYVDPNSTSNFNAVYTQGRLYSNEWIQMNNYSGLYSPNNGAHFYPNNGSYGSWRVAGNRNGWYGLEFDTAAGQTSFMVGTTGQGWGSQMTGFHNNSYGWLWYAVHNNFYAGSFNYTSDERLKKDINIIDNPLLKLNSINGVYFKWKDEINGKGNQIGVTAQNVEKVLPELVSTNIDGDKTVDYARLSALLIEAVKELNKKVDFLKAEMEKLKN